MLGAVRSAHLRATRALEADEQQLREPLKRLPPRRKSALIVLGFSGGRDSSVLLDLLTRLQGERGSGLREVVAVHVHHGLSAQADRWLAHCESRAAAAGASFIARRVAVRRMGQGIEAAARHARYAVLAEVAHEVGARLVYCAHHRDDRLETFLLQWMRGAGLEGLAAFPPVRAFDDGSLRLVRPLIDVARADIDRYIELRALDFVEDDSNADPALARNAVRSEVLPRLEAIRPGFRAAAARSIELVADAADALHSVARDDLRSCTEDAPAGMLRLDALFELPAARQAWTLRAWLASAGLEAPSRARLVDMLAQARDARSDARLLVRVGAREVRRYRGLLLLKDIEVTDSAVQRLIWRGEGEIALPGWGGVLRMTPTTGEGFDPEWLAAEPLEIRPRAGGERFKPHAGRPSRTLKRLFQDAGIPEFERARLPLVWRAEALIYVGGLGADVRLTDRDGERIAIEWQADATLIED